MLTRGTVVGTCNTCDKGGPPKDGCRLNAVHSKANAPGVHGAYDPKSWTCDDDDPMKNGRSPNLASHELPTLSWLLRGI